MSRFRWTILGIAAASFPLSAAAQGGASCPAAAALTGSMHGTIADVRYLADDALEGREAGSPSEHCAGDYLAARFRSIGLQPGAPDGGWFQDFPLRVGSRLAGRTLLTVAMSAAGPGASWMPFGFSPSRSIRAPMLFTERLGQRDRIVADLDLAGKVLVIDRPSGELDEHFLASLAGAHGALGVIILFPEGRPLPSLERESRPEAPVPAIAVATPLADRIREAARAGRTVGIEVGLEPVTVRARNVVALLPGADPALSEEAIVLGAHYDHLGHGGPGSLAPDDVGAIHNGADDNASGVAAILDIARRMHATPAPRRSVYFVAFSGEEEGLRGSAYWVAHPSVPLDRIDAMLNFDMVGRLRDDRLEVFGVNTADEWRRIIDSANRAQQDTFVLGMSGDGFGASDHSSFYGRGIPVLHFFTNVHEDYHRPSDDWQKIDGPGIDRVAALATDVAESVANGERLIPRSGAGDPHAGASRSESEGRGYGPYLGTIPDFTPVEHGVRLTGVREGSPAEKAGLRAGDVIVRFGDRDVTDIYAYTYALREHQAGDSVEIEVVRDGRKVVVTAVLGER